jgi:glycosyltransferase involved in cell wall biosynthesis
VPDERPRSAGLRLGILATHPVQYYSALYRRLAAEPGVALRVFYAHRPGPEEQGVGFGVAFSWDVDLTTGYRHQWLANRAARPSATTFGGCDTPDVAGAIAAGRFDAFLVMGWHSRSYWQAMRACWRTRTPVLVRGDSQLAGDRGRIKRLVKRATYPLFLRRFAAALAVGTRSEEYFRYYGARRVVRSPHFVDNERFGADAAAARSRRAELRAAWGIPSDAFVCLFAGKCVPKKRPLDVVRAVARAAAHVPRRDIRVLVAGDGELRPALEAEAASLGVRLHVAGFLNQSRIAEAYAASDVLVLPSDARETWGLVVNEAMASGVPALVSRDAGCSADLVVEGRTGHAFDRGDVHGLAALISSLASDASRTPRMGAAAADHVAAFSVEAAARGVLAACGVETSS